VAALGGRMPVVATFVLIHGAACSPWHWHLLEPELRDRGHDVLVPDLLCDDDARGLADYADTVVDAIGGRTDLVVVAHSFGGFTGPLVCARVPVDLLVLVTAMIPLPGEVPADVWAHTDHAEALESQAGDEGQSGDEGQDRFFGDLPASLAAEARLRWRKQSGTPSGRPWPLPAWPDVPVRYLLCTRDRFFPEPYMRRVVRDRLGVVPDELDAGHFPMLARPAELAERLVAYL
jgi:pimeloyl-ACP methyl ester carboxylesterase